MGARVQPCSRRLGASGESFDSGFAGIQLYSCRGRHSESLCMQETRKAGVTTHESLSRSAAHKTTKLATQMEEWNNGAFFPAVQRDQGDRRRGRCALARLG